MEGQSHTQNATTLDTNNDGWPEGAGMVEAPGLGAEKLDVAVYTIPPPVRLGPPDRRPILIATNYLLFRGQDTRGRNLPNSAGFVGCRAIGRTHPEHLQLRDNVRLDRAPAKALRTAGRPTDCDRESVGPRHPSRSKRRGPSAAGTGNRPDESTPRKHPASASMWS